MTTTQAETSRGTRTRRENVVLWTLQIVVGLFFLTAASLPKFLGDETAVEMFDEIGFGDWFRYFCAGCELAGAIGLVVPRLAGLAATGLIALMVGACCFVVVVFGEPRLVVTPIVLSVPLAYVARRRLPEVDVSPRSAFAH